MIGLLWNSTRGYRLRPWRSPYLRWRIETYSGLKADEIGFREFWRFLWQWRAELWRYARWADEMSASRREQLDHRAGPDPGDLRR